MAELKIMFNNLSDEVQNSFRRQIAKELEYDARVDFEVEWDSKYAGKAEEDIDITCDDYVDEEMDKWFITIDQKINAYIEENDMGTNYYI